MWLDTIPERMNDGVPRVVSYRWKTGDLRIYKAKPRKDGVITMRLEEVVYLDSTRPKNWGRAAWAAKTGIELCKQMEWVWMPGIRRNGFPLTACPESFQVCVELDLLARRGDS